MEERVLKRNSNIELLRIISMLAIISGHLIHQSNLLSQAKDTMSCVILNIIGYGSRIAVNVFLLIGIWFMVDREFKAKRIIKMYLEVLFYSAILTTVAIFIGKNINIKEILRGYFPFFGRALWFVSAYITLNLLTPYLNKIFNLPKKQLLKLIILLFVFICVISTISDTQENYLSDCLWFVFIYIAIGYFKKNVYQKDKYDKKIMYFLIGTTIYLTLIVLRICFKNNEIIMTITKKYLEDIRTIPNFICAICAFMFFINIKPNYNKFINTIASTTLGVYIIHQVPAFINILWFDICKCNDFYNFKFLPLYVMSVTLGVYIVASIIDFLRIKFIEPIIDNNKFINKICDKIDEFYI